MYIVLTAKPKKKDISQWNLCHIKYIPVSWLVQMSWWMKLQICQN